MTQVDLGEDLIARLEKLARLELGPEERRRLAAELARILEYVAQIEALDTSEVEATTHAGSGEGGRRPDTAKACLPASAALSGAPRSAGGFFLVPPVIDAEAELDHA